MCVNRWRLLLEYMDSNYVKKTTWTGFQPVRERVYQVIIYQNMEQPYSFFYIARMCFNGIRMLKNNTARKSLDYVYGIWQYKGHVFKIML